MSNSDEPDSRTDRNPEKLPLPDLNDVSENSRKRSRSAGKEIFSASTSNPERRRNLQDMQEFPSKRCILCGKNFRTLKGVYGHMRCHPERQWRGINPPPQYRHLFFPENRNNQVEQMNEVETAASCLIMIANSSPEGSQGYEFPGGGQTETLDSSVPSFSCFRFECSSCKKVFGSHQALGGHRATHKNVKGCFAMDKVGEEEQGDRDVNAELKNSNEKVMHNMVMDVGHHCNICLRVFSSGQALGGHMRRHWERGDIQIEGSSKSFHIDLNLPAPKEEEEDSSSSSSSSDVSLNLKLGN